MNNLIKKESIEGDILTEEEYTDYIKRKDEKDNYSEAEKQQRLWEYNAMRHDPNATGLYSGVLASPGILDDIFGFKIL